MNNINAIWPGWETVRLIGRGSFGAVYEIQRNVFGDVEKAALKVISIPQSPSDIDEMYSEGYDEESITGAFQSHLKRIVAEYSLMRKMNGSANVVNCDDIRCVQHDNGIGWDIFIKMELLTPLIKAVPGEITEETVQKLARDICTALNLCKKHSIVHRDIKPQNIFLSDNGDFKLGDFGIAKTIEKTIGGTKIGTYKYMAPEVHNNQPYGHSSDVYSLGLVLYWMLNEQRMPFQPLPPEKLTVKMDEKSRLRRLSGEALPEPAHGSKELKRIVLKACAFAPKDRYASAAAMLADLKRLEAATARGEPRSEEKELPDLLRSVSDDTEEDKTMGPLFRDRTREKLEEQKRRQAELAVRRRKRTIGIACIAAAVLFAVLGLFLLPNSADEKPVLMSDSFSEFVWDEEQQRAVPSEELMVLGSQIPRAKIRSITFLDTLDNAPEDSWDVSQNRDGSVLAWVKPSGDLYDLYIAGNGGVQAPQDCSFLFAEYTSMESFVSKDCFDTSQVMYMGQMFRACVKLTALDLSSWDTSQVQGMWGVFESCTSLAELDVSTWDTAKVQDMADMFHHCEVLVNLDLSNWNTSQVQNMAMMFDGCNNLTELALNSWDTSQVTDMTGMFDCCCSLRELDIGSWNTSQVQNVGMMFHGCCALTELDLRNWNTSHVANMQEMFGGCYRLTSLDLSGWELAQVQDMSGMFEECYGLYAWDASQGCYVLGDLDSWNWDGDNLEKIASQASLEKKPTLMSDPVGAYHWDAEAGRNMPDVEPMVLGSQIPRAKIRSITFLDTLDNAPEDNWDVSMDRDGSVLAWVKPNGDLYDLYIAGNGGVLAPQDCSYLFAEYSALESFCLNDCFDTSSVLKMGNMFRACLKLQTLDLSEWDTSQVQQMYWMFEDCSSLTELSIGDWDTSQVWSMAMMFDGCNNLTELNISDWDTSQVRSMSMMFNGCYNLTELDLNSWDTSQVTNMSMMFHACTNLTKLNIGSWDTSQVQSMNCMFEFCHDLEELALSNWDTSQVTDMTGMFDCCSSLRELDIGNWDTSQVQIMFGIFNECCALTELDLSNWDTSQVQNMAWLFRCCENLTYLDLSSWDTSNVTSMNSMFQDCYGLFVWDESKACYVLDGLNIRNWNVDKVESFDAFVNLDGKPVELYGQPWEDFFN